MAAGVSPPNFKKTGLTRRKLGVSRTRSGEKEPKFPGVPPNACPRWGPVWEKGLKEKEVENPPLKGNPKGRGTPGGFGKPGNSQTFGVGTPKGLGSPRPKGGPTRPGGKAQIITRGNWKNVNPPPWEKSQLSLKTRGETPPKPVPHRGIGNPGWAPLGQALPWGWERDP